MNHANPNIWSMDKDQEIKALLLLLAQQHGNEAFQILDDCQHHQAIRITPVVERPEVSVYIYSYAQPDGCYGVDLEYPVLIEKNADDQTERFNELPIVQALNVISLHLELEQKP